MPRGGWGHLFKPAQGEGHGGPAKGYEHKPPRAFDAEHQVPGVHKGIGRVEAKEYREAIKAKLAKNLHVYDRATAPDAPIMAALKALEMMENRAFGQSKQVIETQQDTRSPDEIRADIARKRKEAGLD